MTKPLSPTDPLISPRFLACAPPPPALRPIGVEKHLPKGTVIIFDANACEGCYYIVHGSVKTYGIDANGEGSLTFILEDGALFLESDLIEGANLARSERTAQFHVDADTDAILFPAEAFRRVVRTDVEASNYIMVSIAQKMHAFRTLLNSSRAHSITWRVANVLASFAQSHGVPVGDRLKIDYNVNQQLLADMLGTNRVTVAKSTKRLKELGLIEKTDDFYYVTDTDELRSFLERAS